jgi:hypothetical protein
MRLATPGETLMPERIQRQRTKGWRVPEGAVYVGRPSRWGNPFVVGSGAIFDGVEVEVTPTIAVGAFRWLTSWWEPSTMRRAVETLGGRDLVCWCPIGDPCHADVLLEIVNRAAALAALGDET